MTQNTTIGQNSLESIAELSFVQPIRNRSTVMNQETHLKDLIASSIESSTVGCRKCEGGLFCSTKDNGNLSLEIRPNLQIKGIKPLLLRTKCARRFIPLKDDHLLTIICVTKTKNDALRARLYLKSIRRCRTKFLADKLLTEWQRATAGVLRARFVGSRMEMDNGQYNISGNREKGRKCKIAF